MMSNMDVITIIGELTLKKERFPLEMILLHRSGMISNRNRRYSHDEKEAIVINIYNAIHPLCRKRGFGMRCFGGSAGTPLLQTIMNMLCVLSEHEGAIL